MALFSISPFKPRGPAGLHMGKFKQVSDKSDSIHSKYFPLFSSVNKVFTNYPDHQVSFGKW